MVIEECWELQLYKRGQVISSWNPEDIFTRKPAPKPIYMECVLKSLLLQRQRDVGPAGDGDPAHQWALSCCHSAGWQGGGMAVSWYADVTSYVTSACCWQCHYIAGKCAHHWLQLVMAPLEALGSTQNDSEVVWKVPNC